MPTFSTPGVFVEELSLRVRSIAPVRTDVVALLGPAAAGPVGRPVACRSPDHAASWFGDGPGLPAALAACFANGARTVVALRVEDERGGELRIGQPARDALDAAAFDLLAVAPSRPGTVVPRHDVVALGRYASGRGAVLLHDTGGAGVGDAVGLARDLATELGAAAADVALYHPSVVDDRDGAVRRAAPVVAGVVAREDRARGVWKAPAGTEATLRGIADVADRVSPGDADAATTAGVNLLRLLPDGSVVVWGARTLASATDPTWRYLPVRRTARMLRTSIARGCAWAVFEPNDEPLWAAVRTSVGDFLHGLFRAGAFAGATPDEAFSVSCGHDTTTAADVAAGRFGVRVAFAPLKPAEFVVVDVWVAAGRV